MDDAAAPSLTLSRMATFPTAEFCFIAGALLFRNFVSGFGIQVVLQLRFCAFHLLAAFSARFFDFQRPIYTPGDDSQGFGPLGGVDGGRYGFNSQAMQIESTSPGSRSSIRFLDDIGSKDTDAGMREWAVAACSPNTSQWVTIGRIIGTDGALGASKSRSFLKNPGNV
ncbi:hypothetical protein R3P38DRAFT_3215259 [Favolaschia claudopus]|uniref:Uncharacterized protein n=1 Tax=Favolaschia claudopus TaxID=2862362 RepID=A0AAW0A8V9_9AGAR